MEQMDIDERKHSHDFLPHETGNEQKIRIVLVMTIVMMVAEITGGIVFGSMSLLADGWHMGTHAAAFGISMFAYAYASKNRNNSDFSFGTGKVGVLGGFSSAIFLGAVALFMVVESTHRLFWPEEIKYNEAILVAGLGLLVNLVCAYILKDDHHHDHGHDHSHHEHDHNLFAAYIHVIADALTSALAIISLLIGKYLGWSWMDALMGIVGAVVISKWALGLMKRTAPILLDASPSQDIYDSIREKIESVSDTHIVDLHLWRLSDQQYSAIISVMASEPKAPEFYKRRLKDLHQVKHLTIEVQSSTESSAPL